MLYRFYKWGDFLTNPYFKVITNKLLNFYIKKLADKIGIDGTIAITIITKIIQAGGAVLCIFFIGKYLSPNEQGYYYTFASILALQLFFELGLTGIITQYAAHEFAHLKWGSNYQLIGDEYYKSRLSSLLRFCVKWFAIIAIIFFFILLIVGFLFFKKFNVNVDIEWQKPWIILCLATALNLFIDPLLAFFDGIGEIKDMVKVRFIQKFLGIVLILIFFILGFKLYSSALASLIAILINYIQIMFSKRKKIIKSIWNEKKDAAINYYKEIFPYQWRIALSWISGYFIFQLFNPVLFATEGAKVAGQMGMTLTALGGVSNLSMGWIFTKVPLFSSLIAKKDFKQLDEIFDKTVKQLFIISLFSVGLFIFFVLGLNKLHISLGDRFLKPLPLLLLCVNVIVNQLVFSWATYLRCHKQEPFLIISIVAGILCCASTYILGHLYGLLGIVSGYTFITLVIGGIGGFVVFVKKKKEWHTV